MGRMFPQEILNESNLAKIADLYIRGWTQLRIGEAIGIAQPTVSKALKKIRQRWLESSLRNFDQRKAEELARIDHLESTYWEAWLRSVGEHEKRITAQKNTEEKKESTARIERENLYGDPRFLQGIERCIEQRCKIFGLYAPTNLKVDWIKLEETLASEWLRVLSGSQVESADLASELPQ